ncbi:hypothetical protein PT974_11412 [Cladobotryum mycophilum]|uniref:Uncharacterized protein n=1 Tax=Cladobotryum mycophilum TaxID=491253 RepID=A0ABR0S620_9HYPO
MMSFASNPIQSSPWRPSVSSPLTSSPIRPTSPQSPSDNNRQRHRLIQSSPIQPIKFKYASRPSKPNPVVRRREDAQEQRRKNFLQNVRQKADNKMWQRRDIEGQFLKTNWLANVGRLTHDAPDFSEADIEDAMAYHQETVHSQDSDDALGVIREEEELDFLVSSYEQEQTGTPQQPPLLEDDEYDDIFAELMSQEPTRQNQPSSSNQMDMSD